MALPRELYPNSRNVGCGYCTYKTEDTIYHRRKTLYGLAVKSTVQHVRFAMDSNHQLNWPSWRLSARGARVCPAMPLDALARSCQIHTCWLGYPDAVSISLINFENRVEYGLTMSGYKSRATVYDSDQKNFISSPPKSYIQIFYTITTSHQPI